MKLTRSIKTGYLVRHVPAEMCAADYGRCGVGQSGRAKQESQVPLVLHEQKFALWPPCCYQEAEHARSLWILLAFSHRLELVAISLRYLNVSQWFAVGLVILCSCGYCVSRQKESCGRAVDKKLRHRVTYGFFTDPKVQRKHVGRVSGEGDGQRTPREKAKKCYLLHPELRERHFLLELEWQ